uniref:KIB1-4 beta-propeller domain-containing protein n=1 Tax=Oryza punctata TaxID=4537 RepID=A0A0E0MGV6_ORYPU
MDGSISGDALLREPWKDIPADLLGLVLRLIPCAADRARVRSVCSSWRDAAAIQRPPPPLPMLVFSRFSFASFSSFSPTMVITEFGRIQLHEDGSLRWVGSFDEWLVGTRPSRVCKYADSHCFLVNAFSRETIQLPRPSAFRLFYYICKTLPIVNTPGSVDIIVREHEYSVCFRKVVLSDSPSSGSMCTLAAISHCILALWHPGMTAWCVCRSFWFDGSADIAFYQGRIYMVMVTTYLPYILSILFFQLEEVDGRVMVSYVEQCVTETLPPVEGCVVKEFHIVEWRGKLLLIVMYADRVWVDRKIQKIGIYALDFSTNPHSLTEIKNLDGDCLFISSRSSKSFPACQYDGAKGDFVYFVSSYRQQSTYACHSFDVVVYNVRDATMSAFPVLVPGDNSGPFMDNLLWLFPPK